MFQLVNLGRIVATDGHMSSSLAADDHRLVPDSCAATQSSREVPSGLEAVVGPKREMKALLGLPCSNHADSVLILVNSLVSGRDNSLRSGRSFKILSPPLPRHRHFYATPNVA